MSVEEEQARALAEARELAEQDAVEKYVGFHFGIGEQVPAGADIFTGGLSEDEVQDRPRSGGLFGPA